MLPTRLRILLHKIAPVLFYEAKCERCETISQRLRKPNKGGMHCEKNQFFRL